MEAPFIEGIQYFSREEEDAARRLASARQDRAKIADIGVKKDDVESIEFMERVRGEIDEWKNLPTVRLTVNLKQEAKRFCVA